MNKEVRELIQSLQQKKDEITLPDFSVLSKESMKNFGSYRNVTDVSHLGFGSHGDAYLLPSQKVLKITDDSTEAEASAVIKGRRLNNVVRIYRVGKIEGETPNKWAILQEYIPNDLNADESLIVNTFASCIFEWASIHNMHMHHINWLDNKTIIKFSSYFERSYPNVFELPIIDQILVSVIGGLRSLRKSGVFYIDTHSGNIRKNSNGQYIIYDLGASFTRDHPHIDIIERRGNLW